MKNRAAKSLVALAIQAKTGDNKTVSMRVSNRRYVNQRFNRYGDLISHFGIQVKNSAAQNRARNHFRMLQLQDHANELFDCTVKPVSLDFVSFNGDGTANVSLGYVINPDAAQFSWRDMNVEQIFEEMKAIHERLASSCDEEQLKRYLGGHWDETLIEVEKESRKSKQPKGVGALCGWSIKRPESLVVKIEDFNSGI